jgi:hypothetical protein
MLSPRRFQLPGLACAIGLALLPLAAASARAAVNLRLNARLDYASDRQDGPLITGDSLAAGAEPGRPAYVLITSQGCFNSKRQARRTVSLYQRYRGRVQFVLIDLDAPRSPAQERLEKMHYTGYIPHVLVLDRAGRALYDRAGEVDETHITPLLEQALASTRR